MLLFPCFNRNESWVLTELNRLIKGLKFITRVVEWIIRKLSNVLNVSNLHDSMRIGLIVIREAIDNSRETLGII